MTPPPVNLPLSSINRPMTTYNGFKNYETWNVCLWLQNDYHFYKIAKDYDSYNRLIPRLEHQYGQITPDGVRWMDGLIDVEAVDEMLSDL